MAPERGQLAALSAVLTEDLAAVQRLDSLLGGLIPKVTAAQPEFRDLAAAAYVLHNIYNALENCFDQISRTFENHITDPAQWHKELLHKMFLEIPTVRPPVLPAHLRTFLNDLRGFRHLFRHSYDFELNAERLSRLVRDWTAERDQVVGALTAFRDFLLAEIGRASL